MCEACHDLDRAREPEEDFWGFYAQVVEDEATLRQEAQEWEDLRADPNGPWAL